MSETVNVTKIF